MKKVMFSALLLLTIICMGVDRGPMDVCECPNGKKGVFRNGVCSCEPENVEQVNKLGIGMMGASQTITFDCMNAFGCPHGMMRVTPPGVCICIP